MWMASHASARDQTDEDLKDMERTYTYSHAPEFEAIYLGNFCEDDQASSVGSSRRMSAEPATITVTPERGLWARLSPSMGPVRDGLSSQKQSARKMDLQSRETLVKIQLSLF
jgi:hypothetical protein